MNPSEPQLNTDGAICPACGRVNPPRHDDEPHLLDEDITHYECHECGTEFRVNLTITYTWRTWLETGAEK